MTRIHFIHENQLARDYETEPVGDAMMRLYESTAKTPKNRLGFLYAPCQFNVVHPEHENLNGITEGWYEIRRTRSWETNPVAIWSLTID